MSWTSPWKAAGGLTNILVSAVENANNVRKNIEAQVDSAMGLGPDAAENSGGSPSRELEAAAAAASSSDERAEDVLEGPSSRGASAAATADGVGLGIAAGEKESEPAQLASTAGIAQHDKLEGSEVALPHGGASVALQSSQLPDDDAAATRGDDGPPIPADSSPALAQSAASSGGSATTEAAGASEGRGLSEGAVTEALGSASPASAISPSPASSLAPAPQHDNTPAPAAAPSAAPAASSSSPATSPSAVAALPRTGSSSGGGPWSTSAPPAPPAAAAAAAASGPALAEASRREAELRLALEMARADAIAAATKAVALGEALRSREGQLEALSVQAARSVDEVAGLRGSLEAAEHRARETAGALEAERKRVKSLRAESSSASKLTERVGELEAEVKERDSRIADILGEGEGLSKKMGQVEVALKAAREKLRAAEEDREDIKEELAEAKAQVATLRERVRILEEETSFARRDKDTASDVATASERRVGAAEEEAARLRSEAKSLRATAAAAAREAEEQRALVVQALNDVEASERGAAEAESALSAARSAEASATRLLGVFEEQVRDLRAQMVAVQAAAGSRDDELRRDLDDMTAKWQRAQSAAEEQGIMALATAYGLNLSGLQSSSQSGLGAAGLFAIAQGEGLDGGAPATPGGGNGAATPRPQFTPGTPHDLALAAAAAAPPGSSIAPVLEALIGQLASLQSELQNKRDTWAAQRTALQARVAAAEAAAEGADEDARRAEAIASETSSAAAGLRTELISLRGLKARADSEAALTVSKLRDSEAHLASLTAGHDALQRQHAELSSAVSDLRLRLEEQSGARAAASHMVAVLKDQLVGAQEEAVSHRREIAALGREVAVLKGGAAGVRGAGRAGDPEGGAATSSSSAVSAPAAASWLQAALAARSAAAASSPGLGAAEGAGGAPPSAVLAALQGLERQRDVLTEQVVALTTKLADMEGLEAQLAHAEGAAAAMQSRANLLLEMLGERDEEVEDLREELVDVRESYKIQLEALMLQGAGTGALKGPGALGGPGGGASSSAAAAHA